MERLTDRERYDPVGAYLERRQRQIAREQWCFATIQVTLLSTVLVLLVAAIAQDNKLTKDCVKTETTRRVDPIPVYFKGGFLIVGPRSEHLYVCPNNRTLWR